MMPELEVLFEDNHCLAVNKPAPLLTQGVPPGIPTLESLAKDHLRVRYGKKGNVYLGIPHRLDRPVSGVVLFARNSKAARRLAEQFHERQVTKVYWGIVEGNLEPAEGHWEDWLRKIPEESRSVVATAETEGARLASMRYRRLSRGPGCTCVEFQPLTGRMHQIRLQCSLRAHPLLGDVQYGSRIAFGPPAELPRDRVIALHARSLTFLHPLRYEPMTVTAPTPALWNPHLLDEPQ